MNAAQKKLQPIMPQPDDAIKAELEARIRVSATAPTDTITSFSRGVNFGVVLANDALASLSLFDFATLDQVPAVEWKFHEADDECTYRWSHNEWLVCPSYDANGIISMYAASFGYSSPHYWNTEAQAKRYAEIKLHTLELQRKLLAELAGGE